MARSCGIRIGPRRYELIVLEGSPKKHKISAFCAGAFDTDTEDPVAAAIAELKEAAKTHNVPHENIGLVIDTGNAAFRRIKLPFSDRAKIEQVIKFEVEGQLPQWNIDDVVVDFHVLAEDNQGCELLVSAIPKHFVKGAIDISVKAGMEPLEAELETSAIVNAAMAADICHLDDAQLLVHVGDFSTSVVVMDGGQVREMRVIHIGALNHEMPSAVEASDEGQGDDPAVRPGLAINPAEASRRVEQTIKRIRRELGRTISAARTVNTIDAVYVCGMELPELIGGRVLDVPVHVLDCFDEDGGQPADGFGALVAAYGAAVNRLGAGFMQPSLRREELRYTGAFERVEFPLAVACLLVCTLLGVINILQFRDRQFLENNGVLYWLRSSNNYMIGDPKAGKLGHLKPVPDDLRDYAAIFTQTSGKPPGRDPDRAPLESLAYIRSNLGEKILGVQKDLGQDSDVTQPQSAFVGMTLVLGILEDNSAEWRPSLRRVHSVYVPGKPGKPDSVKVTIDVTFFDEDTVSASQDLEAFERVLRSQPWFVSYEDKATDALDDERGIFVSGLPITVDVSKYYATQKGGAN